MRNLENTPMGDELACKWLLKEEGSGRIFESWDISLENMPTSHTVTLVLFMYTCYDIAFVMHLLMQ